MKITSILADKFWTDGRGPELSRVHYYGTGSSVKAVDYTDLAGKKRHLIFDGCQAFMFTAEEVHGGTAADVDWPSISPAAIACLGKSAWFQSFNQMHLADCQHFQLQFYDDYLDIICVGISAHEGSYGGGGV